MDLNYLYCLFLLFLHCPKLTLSGDRQGFLSLLCGGTTGFVDSSNISWVPDSDYVTIGNMTTINNIIDGSSSASSSWQTPLRFFPETESRNCYKLPINNLSSLPSSSSLVLIRAVFVYRNYDGLEEPPSFSVSLGTAITSTINLTSTDPWTEEFVWSTVNEDAVVLPFCLHSIPNAGFPVISSIEVRPLPSGAYYTGIDDFTNKLLKKRFRINCGFTNGSLRYPFDQYDRIWDPDRSFSPFHISTGFDMETSFNTSTLKESPPLAVLQTARVLAREEPLTYNFLLDNLGDYYIVLYFAGILPVSPTFDVLINGELLESNYTVWRWEVGSLYFVRKGIKSLNITLKNIGFYPLVNAIEVYEIVGVPEESSSTTVSALQVIQESTGLDLGWEDDPCSPTTWDHIGCEGSSVTSLEFANINFRSISPAFSDLLDLRTLDLHNTSLVGEMQNLGSLRKLEKLNLSFNKLVSFGSDLEALINLQVLDLQNNSLQGIVPESLGRLKNLRLLNLENNRLQGVLPQSLNTQSLEVRTSGNLCLSFSLSTTCVDSSGKPFIETPQVTIFAKKKRKRHNHLTSILGGVGGVVLVVLVVSLSVFLYVRTKRRESTRAKRVEMRNWNAAKEFSYKEIKSATKNFKDVLGRGGFGSVYLGKLSDGKLVAVKVRFDKTLIGNESFFNEVSLLSRIRHQNLVSFEGYCHESKQQILVYEYLPGGSLAENLYGASGKRITLSWVRRLKIAVDAAKGLDYLHNGSDPRIIHRDVKSSNILLDSEMNAKVSDFGLSKQMTQADASHVTTVVKGTAGYLDPEYYSTQQLNEKSDIYSFGVVLLELICGREPLRRTGSPDSFNLVLWAKPYLQAGVYEIVDESIKGCFDVESMRKAALIASRSVERDASQRPTIAQVLAELKEAYSIQLSYLASSELPI